MYNYKYHKNIYIGIYHIKEYYIPRTRGRYPSFRWWGCLFN